jgi:hypothetical protein
MFRRIFSASLAMFLSMSAVCAFAQDDKNQEKTVKLLTIGNSFAQNALKYLDQIVKGQGRKIIIGRANLGGCPLDRHWNNAEKDLKEYKYKGKKLTLTEMLQAEKWDIVTIQQVSHKSFKRETFEPYAANLIALIKKYAPQAEIVIHQTWAYRADHNWFTKKDATLTQQKMYDGALANYLWLADKYKLRVFPSGAAIQLCREIQPVKFTFPDPKFDYKNAEKPALPNQDGSLIVGLSWRKNKAGKWYMGNDAIHANPRAEYMIGCAWYEMIYGDNAENVKFVPKGIDEKDAEFLRKTAHQAVEDFKQVK